MFPPPMPACEFVQGRRHGVVLGWANISGKKSVCVCSRVCSNALCGSLQCDITSVVDPQLVNFHATLSPLASRTVNNHPCTAVHFPTFYDGPDARDPGLVPHGAACERGKVRRTLLYHPP